MRKNTICGWILTDDCVDFYAADFGWEVKRWFQLAPFLSNFNEVGGVTLSGNISN
jgi:hypothetical protein